MYESRLKGNPENSLNNIVLLYFFAFVNESSTKTMGSMVGDIGLNVSINLTPNVGPTFTEGIVFP